MCKGRNKGKKKKSATRKISEIADHPTENCATCSKEFTDENDRLIGCDRCLKWFCQPCTKLSDLMYNALNEQTDVDSLYWYCKDCTAPAKKEVRTGCVIDKRCKELEDKLEKVRSRILEDMKKEIKDELTLKMAAFKQDFEQQIADLRADLTTNTTRTDNENTISPGPHATAASTKASIDEMSLRDEKKTNIIIFSVPESDSIVSEERVEHDEKFVIEFLNTIKCDTLNVKKIFRLGQKCCKIKNRLHSII